MSDMPSRITPDMAFEPLWLPSVALARNWWAILVRGIAALVFGLVALLLPGAALTALALVFGAYLLVDGAFAVVAAILAVAHRGHWALLLLEGVLTLVLALLALLMPGAVVLGTVWLIAAWAIVTGGLMIAAAFRLHRDHGNWLLGLGGLISVIWGVLLWLAPLVGALVLAIWLGLYAIIFGIAMIALAFRLRRRHIALHGSMPA